MLDLRAGCWRPPAPVFPAFSSSEIFPLKYQIFPFFPIFPEIPILLPHLQSQPLYAPRLLNPADGGSDASVFQSQTHMQIFRSIWPAPVQFFIFPESAYPLSRSISLRGPVPRSYAPDQRFLQKNFTKILQISLDKRG